MRRTHSPASVDVDFAAELAARGATGALDENTIEVVAYDDAGKPRDFDRARGDARALVPWRLERAYPLSRVRMSFVMPDERATRYAVYFDTTEAARPRPPRYPGIVGDGGWVDLAQLIVILAGQVFVVFPETVEGGEIRRCRNKTVSRPLARSSPTGTCTRA